MRNWNPLSVRSFNPAAIAIGALLIASCAGPQAPGSGAPVSPVQSRPTPVQEWNPFIVSDSDGRVYLSYYAGPGGGSPILHFTRSLDGGLTWPAESIQVETAQPKGRRIGFHKLEADGRGNVYITWSIEREFQTQHWRTIEVRRRHSSDFGATWPGGPTTWIPTSTVRYLTSWTGIDGEMYVIWVGAEGGAQGLFFNRTDRGGTVWLPTPVRIDSTRLHPSVRQAEQQSRPSPGWPAAVHDSEGHIFAAWQDEQIRPQNIYFNASADRGATWAFPDTRLDSSLDRLRVSRLPQITTDGRGSVYVTWEDMRASRREPFFNRSLDRGLTWLTQDIRLSAERPVKDKTNAFDPVISADRQGRVYAVWKESVHPSAATIHFTASMDRGSTWFIRPRQLDHHEAEVDADGVRLGHDGDGHVYAVWAEIESKKKGGAIRFNRSSDYGESWLPHPTQLSNNAELTPVRLPRMSVDGAGRIYVVWSGEQDGKLKLFLNRSVDHGETWLPREIHVTP